MLHRVYLLVHHSEPRYKIGRTRELWHRIEALGADQFDYANSLALGVKDAPAAENLERILQRIFHGYRLPAARVGPVTREGKGNTEWFDRTSFKAASEFLKREQSLLGFSFEPLDRPAKVFTDEMLAKRRAREEEEQRLARGRQFRACYDAAKRRFDETVRQQREQLKALKAASTKIGLFKRYMERDESKPPILVGEAPRSAAPHIQVILSRRQALDASYSFEDSRFPALFTAAPFRLHTEPKLRIHPTRVLFTFQPSGREALAFEPTAILGPNGQREFDEEKRKYIDLIEDTKANFWQENCTEVIADHSHVPRRIEDCLEWERLYNYFVRSLSPMLKGQINDR
jgi:hypothetical protein